MKENMETGGKATAVKPVWLQVLLIAILAFVVYSNSVSNEFVSDDNHFIVNNMSLKNVGNAWKLLSPTGTSRFPVTITSCRSLLFLTS